MAPRKVTKDRTSVVISVIAHVAVLGGIGYWAHKTGQLEFISRKILQAVRGDKKPEPAAPPKQAAPKPAAPLPPINQGAPPPPGGGSRRAVAEDAPAAVGESFFADARTQSKAGGTGTGGGPETNSAQRVVALAPPKAAVPRPVFASSSGPSTIKQLLAQRAREAASTEAFGSEQISKSGVSDAGAIIGKVSGASVVDGKFAVIRGLSDRYVTTTFNGAEIPSADPYRRSASLDLFPAQIIDKVVVAKTFTPDKQGTYTGGGIDIISKSFPEKGFTSFSSGAAFNSQATGNKNFLTYAGGGTDWAAMDDGTRAIPSSLSAKNLTLPNPVFSSGLPSSVNYAVNVANANKLAQLTKDLGVTQWAPTREAPGPDHNFSVAAGDTTHFFGRPFGVFLGGSYRHEYKLWDKGEVRSYNPGSQTGQFDVASQYDEKRSFDTVNWSGMVNLAWQPLDNHEISFNFLYNQNGENAVRTREGTSINDPGTLFFQNRLQWTERNLTTYQLKGTHTLPALASLKLDWMAALSQTTQDEPDTRFFSYLSNGGSAQTGKSGLPEPKEPTRFFRTLEEQNKNVKADITLPFRQWSYLDSEAKVGGFYSASDRTFLARELYYLGNTTFDGDPNHFLTPSTLGYVATTNNTTRRITYDWPHYISTRSSSYEASSSIPAGYFMVDMPVLEKVRLVTGLRYEATDIRIHSQSYLASPETGLATNDTSLVHQDFLPAAGIIYSFRTNMNFRLHYSQTVARPSFRELAAVNDYDPVLDLQLVGNPRLTMSQIDNYDFRWEWFPSASSLLSASIFHKEIRGAIERKSIDRGGDTVTFENGDRATVSGVEFEVRQNLEFISPSLRNLTLGGNLALIQSETKYSHAVLNSKQLYLNNPKATRPLYDQSPYLINAELSYDNARSGTSASLLFNISGPRIAFVNLTSEDTYEQPAPMLDFIFSQKLTRHFGLKFTAKNLLDPKIERSLGEAGKLVSNSYRRGLTLAFSVGGEF